MTAEMFDVIVSWPTFGMVLLVFGFLPGTVLRLVVRLYPKGDPRREELVNDLYVMKPYQRPLWVVQQLETALHEGLAERWSLWLDKPYSAIRTYAFLLLWSSISMALSTTFAIAIGDLPVWVAFIVGPLVLLGIAESGRRYRLLSRFFRWQKMEPRLLAIQEEIELIAVELDEEAGKALPERLLRPADYYTARSRRLVALRAELTALHKYCRSWLRRS